MAKGLPNITAMTTLATVLTIFLMQLNPPCRCSVRSWSSSLNGGLHGWHAHLNDAASAVVPCLVPSPTSLLLHIGDAEGPIRRQEGGAVRGTVRVEAVDYLRGPGGPSASTGQTVRKCHPNFQYCTSKNGQSVPYPRTVRGQLVPRRLSATSRQTVRKHRATKINFPDGSNHERARTSNELDEHRASRTFRSYKADCLPGADRAA
jgi:hypothetical protein